jgi:hypothetical protein
MSNNFDRHDRPQRPSPQFAHYENVTLLGPPTMRGALVFGGSSHPKLVEGICDRLGMKPGSATLGKFKNGETSVTIRMSGHHSGVPQVLTVCRHVNPEQGCLHRPEWKREVRSPAFLSVNG